MMSSSDGSEGAEKDRPHRSAEQKKNNNRIRFPNPAEHGNPDPATLRDQWRYAVRQYGRWYSHAWGTAIFAGFSFFALGWIIKGSNPLPSLSNPNPNPNPNPNHDGSID